MIAKPRESISLWMDSVEMPRCPSLSENINAEICIVGGGIAGLTAAYLLLKECKHVCVLEDYELGSGQSGRTTAQFSTVLGDRYFDLEKSHGVEGAKLIAESHGTAIEKVAEIIAATIGAVLLLVIVRLVKRGGRW